MEAGGPEALVVGGGHRHGGVLRNPCPTELGGAASPAWSDDPRHPRQRPLVGVQQGGAAPAAALLGAPEARLPEVRRSRWIGGGDGSGGVEGGGGCVPIVVGFPPAPGVACRTAKRSGTGDSGTSGGVGAGSHVRRHEGGDVLHQRAGAVPRLVVVRDGGRSRADE